MWSLIYFDIVKKEKLDKIDRSYRLKRPGAIESSGVIGQKEF